MKRIDTLNWSTIAEEYKSGLGLYSLGIKYKCSPATIRDNLRKRGTTTFPNRRPNQLGENNPNFKNGLSKSTVNRIVKRNLVAAGIDLYTCMRCLKRFGYKLNRHHKDRDRSNNKIENIEVLCEACHAIEHLNEKQRDEHGQWA